MNSDDCQTFSPADSHSSNEENFNDVFMDEPTVGHCEQCGRVTEIHQYRGPRRFCSTSCARRYSVSCSRKMIAFRERMKGRGHHHSSSHIQSTSPSHRKITYSPSLVSSVAFYLWGFTLNEKWLQNFMVAYTYCTMPKNNKHVFSMFYTIF